MAHDFAILVGLLWVAIGFFKKWEWIDRNSILEPVSIVLVGVSFVILGNVDKVSWLTVVGVLAVVYGVCEAIFTVRRELQDPSR